MAKKFIIMKTYVYLTVLALIFLYGGHCFSVQMPSYVACVCVLTRNRRSGLGASRNGVY